jgi:hypothetical protein
MGGGEFCLTSPLTYNLVFVINNFTISALCWYTLRYLSDATFPSYDFEQPRIVRLNKTVLL